MPDYKKMYFQLAAKTAYAIDILTKAMEDCDYEYALKSPEKPVEKKMKKKKINFLNIKKRHLLF